MIALLLGLLAALCWSTHDLLARVFASSIGPLRMGLWIMVLGGALLLAPVVWRGQIWQADQNAIFMALAMGVVYALAVAALLTAFSHAPVSIVGPFTAGYPALVVVWGMLHGLVLTSLQFLAIAAILAGAVVVGRNSASDGGLAKIQPGKLPLVIIAALIADICFASSIILGQTATTGLGEYETTFISRFSAAFVMALLIRREPSRSVKITPVGWLAITLMTISDVVAVTAINASTYFEGKEFGAMAISGYGGLSVFLAMIFLKEKVTLNQWGGILMITAGVAALAV